jgi:hypothetical protein
VADSSEPLFIVRAWPADASVMPVDETGAGLDAAIDRARELAHDRQYRSVAVLDPWAAVWAQFNMLWSNDGR